MKIGHVTHIYRHPIKSLLGERIDSAMINETGVKGDRERALRDTETGKLASAKRPQLWRALLSARARFTEPGDEVVVELPNKDLLHTSDVEFNAQMSGFLGRSVELISNRPEGAKLDRSDPLEVAASESTQLVTSTELEIGAAAADQGFVDFAPIHILSESSLRFIQRACNLGEEDVIRFRPNIVVDDTSRKPFCENDWAGSQLQIGDVRLRVIVSTPRCAVPMLKHGPLGEEKTIMRKLFDNNLVEIEGYGNQPCLGAYAIVEKGGKIENAQDVLMNP